MFDRDNAVSKAQRQWLRDIDKLRVDFDAGLAAANEMLIECKAHSEDPHFKKAKYKWRIINNQLLAEYAYVMKIGV